MICTEIIKFWKADQDINNSENRLISRFESLLFPKTQKQIKQKKKLK
jgi:uncharacterized tellurite resistance protein B-like protein